MTAEIEVGKSYRGSVTSKNLRLVSSRFFPGRRLVTYQRLATFPGQANRGYSSKLGDEIWVKCIWHSMTKAAVKLSRKAAMDERDKQMAEKKLIR